MRFHSPKRFPACLFCGLQLAHTAQAATLNVAADEVAIINNNRCSLREAIINANNNAATYADCAAGNGADTINLPAGTYLLNQIGFRENNGLTGDLDIAGDTTINGAATATTVIDGNQTDRVIQIISGIVALNNLTVRNGRTSNGATGDDCNGDCFGSDGGAGENGGGILNAGTLALNRVTVSGNRTGDGGAAAAIVDCPGENAFCLSDSESQGNGGGVTTAASPNISISTSVFAGNTAFDGGAILQ